MTKSKFTKEQIEFLLKNPNVADVSRDLISYSNEFKLEFVSRYLNGEKPAEIFESSGLPKELIGKKRIERAKDRWLLSYAKGSLGQQHELTPAGSTLLDRKNRQIKELKKTVEVQKKIILDLTKRLHK